MITLSHGPRYLKQCPGRVLQGIEHQARTVPKGQRVAEEDDEPHVAREEAHDQPLPDPPALGGDQVLVVPAQLTGRTKGKS